MEIRTIIHTMATVSTVHRSFVSKAANSAGLYFGQPPLLEYVREHPGCTQNELCEIMHVSAPSVAVSVKRLERSGLIEKKPDNDDMRRNMLFITADGELALDRFHENCRDIDERLFDGFSDDDRQAFLDILTHMLHNLCSDDLKPDEIRRLMDEERHHKKDLE